MKKKILVVEDEFIIARDIKEILEEAGYDVISNIGTYNEAVIAIETHFPQMVILDINLNQLKDGIDIGHFLLIKDDIPFIYLTSHSDANSLDRAKETRPYGYITKPFKPIDLLATVEIVLNNYRYKAIDFKRSIVPVATDVTFRIKAAIAYIDKNIHEKIELSQLALICKWSKQHFIKVFQEQMKQSPYQFILNRKIEKSKILIAENNLTLTEISFELGFKSYSNFCGAFKKTVKISPNHYKVQLLQ